jgi:uncharacterized protein with HEPN domain
MRSSAILSGCPRRRATFLRNLKSQHKNVPWRAVAGLGNVLRHDYPRVKDPRVWRIVSHDLAPLKAAVEAMLQEIDGNALDRT